MCVGYGPMWHAGIGEMRMTPPTGKVAVHLLSGPMLLRGGLAVLSGVLLALSFPRFHLAPLAFGALVPLLVGLHGVSIFQGTFLGIIAGMVFYLMSIPWVVHTMVTYGGLPFPSAFSSSLRFPCTSPCTSAFLLTGLPDSPLEEVSRIFSGPPPSG